MAKSEIHGFGLFTQDSIEKDDIILRFGGRLLLDNARFSKAIVRSTALFLSDNVLLAQPAGTERDISDFINHSCSPNSGLSDAITLVAIERIEPGREITSDYAFWEGASGYRMKSTCECGSRYCRGTITGDDWRLEFVRMNYYSYFSPFIRRRIDSFGKHGEA